MKKQSSGFTLLELLVVIGIVAILSGIILAYLSGAKSKANDSKVMHQLSDMRSQAALWFNPLYTGGAVAPSTTVLTAATGASGSLLNDATTADNSLWMLISGLPTGTNYYYAWDGVTPSTGSSHWFFAASTGTGAVCADWAGISRAIAGTPPTTAAQFTSAAYFPNATVAGGYSCN